MNRRITITLDEVLEKKIRELQAKEIIENNRAVSFSTMVNQVVKKGLNGF